MCCMYTLYTDDQELMNTPIPTVNARADRLLLWGDSAGTTGSSLMQEPKMELNTASGIGMGVGRHMLGKGLSSPLKQ